MVTTSRENPLSLLELAAPSEERAGRLVSDDLCVGRFARSGLQATFEPLSGFGIPSDKDGQPRATYLNHVADNEHTMREYGSQAVVRQTALNPVIGLELLATGAWKGTGVLGPEAFDALSFLDLLAEYDRPFGLSERA